MNDSAQQSLDRWRKIVSRVANEWASLPDADRSWVFGRLERIARLQRGLHGLFLDADGAQLCRLCQGACCGCGRNHFTLVNLLAYLAVGTVPPEPDYRLGCPFLGARGCRLDEERRPFNCVTFFCETLEARLDRDRLQSFYAKEKALRALHQEFDRRFAGSSLRGILIRAERLGDIPFLCPPTL